MEKLEKNEIRKWVKDQRKALDSTTEMIWNDSICEQLLNTEEVRKSFCIYCYASFLHEVSTWKFMDAVLKQGKYIAVPKVNGKELDFYAIFGKADLEEGTMGIMEPKQSCLKIHDEEAPVIVPGLAFDTEGNRIGYGGGYYDRFFKREPHHFGIALAYGFQMFDRIPAESHDVCMNRIITP